MTFDVYSAEKGPGVFIIHLVGSLDTDTYTVFEKKVDYIMESSPHAIIFDMEKLDYITSMGLRVILRANKTLKMNGGRINLINLQPQIRKVFNIINALPSQQIFSSMEELDNYLDTIQRQVK